MPISKQHIGLKSFPRDLVIAYFECLRNGHGVCSTGFRTREYPKSPYSIRRAKVSPKKQ